MKEIFKKDGTLNVFAKDMLIRLVLADGRYHGVREWSGRINFSRDETARELLRALGINFDVKNDAPRGGVKGTYLSYSPRCLALKLAEMVVKRGES